MERILKHHSDHLGSTSLITDLDGNVEYIPYGEVFIEERNSAWNTPYKFNAKELDEETGLYYYGARYYDPRTSVWLSADPLQEKYPGVSTYCYCMNNPLRYIDSDGRVPKLAIILETKPGKNEFEQHVKSLQNAGFVLHQKQMILKEFLMGDGTNSLKQFSPKTIKNRMLPITKTIGISFIILIMLTQNCNAQKNETVADIDTLLKKYTTIYFSNNTTQEEKYEYLYLVYNSYLESEDSFFSIIAESMLIFATKYASSSYYYYLFDNKMREIYKNIKNKKLANKTIVKMNRLASIFSIQSRYEDLFFTEKCKEINPLLLQNPFEASLKNQNEQEELLNKGFDFNEFKHLIDAYIEFINVDDEEIFEAKLELRKEIIKMHFQLIAIKTGDSRFITK